jgi:hypothetical protein
LATRMERKEFWCCICIGPIEYKLQSIGNGHVTLPSLWDSDNVESDFTAHKFITADVFLIAKWSRYIFKLP